VTPERWQRVTTLFRRARECDPSERSALLGEACGDDSALRREVESLLAVYDEPSDLLARPLLGPDLGEALWDEVAVEPARAPSIPPNNLRRALTSFVGREPEVTSVLRLLATARLVTLQGVGGIGKTRLALAAAEEVLAEYPDGVWVVELASLADPGLVTGAVASALGVREEPGAPLSEILARAVRTKRMLLVLDNCEHVVEACAGLAETLLQASAGLRVLATSREALGVTGETAWLLSPLSLPKAKDASVEEIADCEAVALFVERAQFAKPGFALTARNAVATAEVCRRLEGIPLAIELAAARVRVLTVERILERLDDKFRLLAGSGRTTPSRQQTLRAALDWSYELLTEEERALLRRLSVFAGGFTLDAAEEVAGCRLLVAGSVDTTVRSEPNIRSKRTVSEPEPATSNQQPATADVLDHLTRLVDKSLLFVAERKRAARYGMLEMVREYGLERLSQSGEEEAVRRRHAQYFIDLAEESRLAINAGHSAEWLERLEVEHDNARSALAWLLENDADGCLTLAAALNPFRELRGHLTEARRVLETALERHPTASSDLRARALNAAGNVASIRGDLTAARGYYLRALRIAKESGNLEQISHVTYGLAMIANLEGDLNASRAYLHESLEIARRDEDDVLASQCLNSLGEAARIEGELGVARGYYEKAVALFQREGHDHFRIVSLCNLGAVACESDDPDAARACYVEALGTARALGSLEFMSLALDGLAAIAVKRGAWERAGRIAGAAGVMLEASGAAMSPVDRAFRDRYLAEARAALGEEGFDAALADGRAMTVEEAVGEAAPI
jgi:predicted ATPase